MCHTWKWFRKYIINKILSSDIYKYLSVADHLTESERVARSYQKLLLCMTQLLVGAIELLLKTTEIVLFNASYSSSSESSIRPFFSSLIFFDSCSGSPSSSSSSSSSVSSSSSLNGQCLVNASSYIV